MRRFRGQVRREIGGEFAAEFEGESESELEKLLKCSDPPPGKPTASFNFTTRDPRCEASHFPTLVEPNSCSSLIKHSFLSFAFVDSFFHYSRQWLMRYKPHLQPTERAHLQPTGRCMKLNIIIDPGPEVVPGSIICVGVSVYHTICYLLPALVEMQRPMLESAPT